MINLRRIALFSLVLAVAVGASASNFRAADLVYLPAAANTPGSGGSFFKTDVWISNVNDVAVDVDVAYGTTGGGSNVTMLQAANLRRITLAAGERREIRDIVGSGLMNVAPPTLGHMLFFGCRQGGNCSNCDTDDSDCRNITVEGRIYTTASGALCPGNAANCTFGQLFSGLPWYNYVSPTVAPVGLDEVFMVGINQFGTPGPTGSGFRSNVGVVNSSDSHNVVVRLRVFANNNPTTPAGTTTVTLGPLGHVQQNISVLFPGFTGSGFVVADMQSNTLIDPNQQNPPDPGFFAYASVLDNVSGDPTTQEAQYSEPLPFALVYKEGMRRPARRR
jgi:hypothetical protein